VSSWPLQALLALREREALASALALGAAEGRVRKLRGEADGARAEAHQAALRALGNIPPGAPPGLVLRRLAAGARAAERARLEAASHARRAEALSAKARAAGAEVERLRLRLRRAAVQQELVQQLEMAWRRERSEAAARRAEAALDDRPWQGGQAGRFSASRPAAG
jgi:ElaB/YqjD/DUF883 family membrane-anchored ribosome-binding protein